jgi:hypothetical protein
MHAGTLEKLLQLGAPEFTGFKNVGLLPTVLPSPKENPLLLSISMLSPPTPEIQLFVAISDSFPLSSTNP